MKFQTKSNRNNTFERIFSLNRYFPKGGGYCKVDIRPVVYLKPIELIEFGDIKQIFGWSFVAGALPVHVKLRFTVLD